MPLDFAGLAADLLQHSRALLAEWFPAGRLRGAEFVLGDLTGAEGESLSINVDTGKWMDFATGAKGGDLISLYAAAHGMDNGAAFKALSAGGTKPARAPSASKAPRKRQAFEVIPVPAGAPPPDKWNKRLDDGTYESPPLTKRWTYRDSSGAVVGYTVRFDGSTGKDIIPQVWTRDRDTGREQWRWKSMPKPRPLYNLTAIIARPDAPIIVVEGEKCADAIATLAPQYVGVAWAGGAQAWQMSDWAPLAGRQVLLWPDGDRQTTAAGELKPLIEQPGMTCMWGLGRALVNICAGVKLLIPDDESLPDGWDAADAVRDGWTWDTFKPWALRRVLKLENGQSHERIHWQRSTHAQDVRPHASEGPAAGAATAAPHTVGAAVDGDGDRDDDDGDTGAGGHPERTVGRVGGAAEPDRSATGGGNGGHGAHGEPGRGDAASVAEASTVGGPQSIIGRWLAWDLERYGNSPPVCNLNNAVTVLNRDPALRGIVWYDEFLGKILTGAPPREWEDVDDVRLQHYMQRSVGLSKMGIATVRDAVALVAQQQRHDVARDWMRQLEWDGTERIRSMLHVVFGTEDSSYCRAVSANFWISMVARTMQPGCQCDNMLILEGKQGYLKSTALALIGGDWYAEQHESAANPRAFAEVLVGKLVVEISEMGSFGKAENTQIKRSISCRSDRYRAPYSRNAVDHPRRCVLVGTTNRDDWNRDETGARRFWPIKVTRRADIKWLREHREQCFAEAVAAHRDGATWWMVPADDAEREQRQRFEVDPWRDAIGEWIVGREWTYVTEVAHDCLKIVPQDMDMSTARRITSVLRELGYVTNGVRRVSGTVVRAYERMDDEDVNIEAAAFE